MSPDDTSREDWDQLKASYHLEDKVVFEAMGDNMKQEPRMQSTLRERSTRKVTTLGTSGNMFNLIWVALALARDIA